jgi:hypothetical protein
MSYQSKLTENQKLHLRSVLLKNDLFLANLYMAKTKYLRRNVLESASVAELDVVLLILHLLVNKHIPLKRQFFDSIKKKWKNVAFEKYQKGIRLSRY